MKRTSLLPLSICLFTCAAHTMNLVKDSDAQASETKEATKLIDEGANVYVEKLLLEQEKLQTMRARAKATNFGTTLEQAISILTNEQKGCSFNPMGGFSFACNNELQTLVYAVSDHKNLLLAKIHEIMMSMEKHAQAFQINADKKEVFVSGCQELQGLVTRAQERTSKLEFVLPPDAKIIGPRTYALCNLFGTLDNLSKQSNASKKAQETAEHIVQESLDMYRFMQMQG